MLDLTNSKSNRHSFTVYQSAIIKKWDEISRAGKVILRGKHRYPSNKDSISFLFLFRVVVVANRIRVYHRFNPLGSGVSLSWKEIARYSRLLHPEDRIRASFSLLRGVNSIHPISDRKSVGGAAVFSTPPFHPRNIVRNCFGDVKRVVAFGSYSLTRRETHARSSPFSLLLFPFSLSLHVFLPQLTRTWKFDSLGCTRAAA